jgi:sulfur-oxidizing protein SoxY
MDSDRAIGRRTFVRAAALAAAAAAVAVGTPALAIARTGPSTGPDDEMTDAVKKVLADKFGTRTLQSGHVQFDIPADAPDGRAVPVFIETDFDPTPEHYVKAFHLIVDHNPDIYLAGYQFSSSLGGASVDTRIKMRRTSWVRAIAETNTGELWVSAKKVFVGLNGCG